MPNKWVRAITISRYIPIPLAWGEHFRNGSTINASALTRPRPCSRYTALINKIDQCYESISASSTVGVLQKASADRDRHGSLWQRASLGLRTDRARSRGASDSPQYVKPYVKRGKNDRNDAEAICETAGRPGMHFVPVKSVTQQARGMVLKVRETLVSQRTRMTNTLRGHAAEFGVIAGKGLRQIGPLLTAIEQETTIPAEAREIAALLGQEIEHLDRRIKEIDVKLAAAHKANDVSQRLATIPGVGPVTALTLAIEVDPAAFESGRHLAAWAGLTPKEHSTGGKQRMGGIRRAGNERLRVLLVVGVTSVIKAAMRPGSALMTD